MDFVFQYPGWMITYIIDVIGTRGKVDIYSLLHEQSIAFAVSIDGRLSNLPSIAFATSGPSTVLIDIPMNIQRTQIDVDLKKPAVKRRHYL